MEPWELFSVSSPIRWSFVVSLADTIRSPAQDLVREEGTILHRLIQAHIVLENNPTGADVHMPRLGIACFARF